MDKVSVVLRRVMPAVAGPDDALHPVEALVPWACDALQSKWRLNAYVQDIRDFLTHMERFGIKPLDRERETGTFYRITFPASLDAGRSQSPFFGRIGLRAA